ncbi:MAG: heme-binding protein, partial [Blastocatellia bacterium]
LELVKTALFDILSGVPLTRCSQVPNVPNGTQIFPGSVPLYRNGSLVGGLGVSGDGVDQDDIISTMGSAGFEAPLNIRADQIFVRGVRLPYVKFPRHPDL